MKPEFDPRRLDVKRFAQEAGRLDSAQPLREYPRLLDETQGRGDETPVRWSARGEMRNPSRVQPQVWIHLEADTRLALVCQRCLNPVDADVSVRRSFRFVPDESTAAAEDDESQEDVLAESRSFDLVQLVEDELLMDMPLAPRHEQCPEALPASVADPGFEQVPGRRENPFEVLARLKRPRH